MKPRYTGIVVPRGQYIVEIYEDFGMYGERLVERTAFNTEKSADAYLQNRLDGTRPEPAPWAVTF